jgi:hypothetical protein
VLIQNATLCSGTRRGTVERRRRYRRLVAEVSELLARYESVLAEMHNQRVEIGGNSRKWNRLVDKMQRLHLELRQTPEGRAGITALAFDGENETVRSWSATNALAWDADRVRPLIEARASGARGLDRLSAEMALKEFDAGRLNTAWVPGGR